MILIDNKTKVVVLSNNAIATTIIGLLRTKSDHPLTIGEHCDRDAGKSSFLELTVVAIDDGVGIIRESIVQSRSFQ